MGLSGDLDVSLKDLKVQGQGMLLKDRTVVTATTSVKRRLFFTQEVEIQREQGQVIKAQSLAPVLCLLQQASIS